MDANATSAALREESNAPDTYTGPKTSPEGYVYQFGLRGGDKAKGEDPARQYVITDPATGEPLRMLRYDGKAYGTAAEIAAYKAQLVREGYAIAHLEPAEDIPGHANGYPMMAPGDVKRALAGVDLKNFDVAVANEAQRHALQNLGYRASVFRGSRAHEVRAPRAASSPAASPDKATE